MSSLGRKTLFYLFAGLFLILVPVVFLYGQGYRVNLEERRLAETGSIYIETTPKRATVTVDGEVQESVSPLLLNELDPGNMIVEVSLPDYQTWKQLAKVEAKKSVLYSAIELFLADPEKELLVDQVSAIHQSRNGRYILLEKEDVIALFNASQHSLEWAQPHPNAEIIEWSPDDQWILFFDGENYFALDRSTGAATRPFEDFSQIITVHLLENDRALVIREGEVVELDLISQEILKRTSVVHVLDAMKRDDELWILQNRSGHRIAVETDGSMTYLEDNLPTSITTFYPNQNPLILTDDTGTEAWEVTENDEDETDQLTALKDQFLSYSDNKGADLYAYVHELETTDEDYLGTLVRQSEPIDDAEWYDAGYLLYLSNGTLYAHDVLYEPYANTFPLTKQETQAMAGSPRKGYVYVLQDGAFSRLEIQ